MSDNITALINKLSHLPPDSKELRGVSHPDLLIAALKDFNAIIGNNKLKDDIAIQIEYIIRKRNKSKAVMLNTALFGSPGTGKTEIGKKLARIWYAIGCLGTKEEAGVPLTSQLGNALSGIDMETAVFFIIALFVLYLVLSYVVVWLGERIGTYYAYLLAFAVILVTVIVTLYLVYGNGKGNQPDQPTKTKDETLLEESYFRVVSREDFVGKYVGWSDKKTIDLLTSCLGKVIFIDEFYSLLNSSHDEFGMEALTALTRFMSENAGKIVVIIGGYKKQIIEGPFAAQPGLKRRFMWNYEMQGYSPSELYLIFVQQAAKEGWKIRDGERIKKLFETNADAFPNYGGDTERLVYYAGLQNTRDSISRDDADETLDYSQVQSALEELRMNNVQKANLNDEKHTLEELLSMMQRGGMRM